MPLPQNKTAYATQMADGLSVFGVHLGLFYKVVVLCFRLPEKELKRVGNKLPTYKVLSVTVGCVVPPYKGFGGSKTHPTALLYLCRVGFQPTNNAKGVAFLSFRLPETIYSAVNIAFCRYGGLGSPPYKGFVRYGGQECPPYIIFSRPYHREILLG